MRLVVSLVAASALVLSGAARAQNLSFGSINATVTDTSGGALPGVTVTAASPALQVGQLTAVTDGEGKYQIVDLPRGTYQVRFELQGFQLTGIGLPNNAPAQGARNRDDQ